MVSSLFSTYHISTILCYISRYQNILKRFRGKTPKPNTIKQIISETPKSPANTTNLLRPKSPDLIDHNKSSHTTTKPESFTLPQEHKNITVPKSYEYDYKSPQDKFKLLPKPNNDHSNNNNNKPSIEIPQKEPYKFPLPDLSTDPSKLLLKGIPPQYQKDKTNVDKSSPSQTNNNNPGSTTQSSSPNNINFPKPNEYHLPMLTNGDNSLHNVDTSDIEGFPLPLAPIPVPIAITFPFLPFSQNPSTAIPKANEHIHNIYTSVEEILNQRLNNNNSPDVLKACEELRKRNLFKNNDALHPELTNLGVGKNTGLEVLNKKLLITFSKHTT